MKKTLLALLLLLAFSGCSSGKLKNGSGDPLTVWKGSEALLQTSGVYDVMYTGIESCDVFGELRQIRGAVVCGRIKSAEEYYIRIQNKKDSQYAALNDLGLTAYEIEVKEVICCCADLAELENKTLKVATSYPSGFRLDSIPVPKAGQEYMLFICPAEQGEGDAFGVYKNGIASWNACYPQQLMFNLGDAEDTQKRINQAVAGLVSGKNASAADADFLKAEGENYTLEEFVSFITAKLDEKG